MTVKRDALGRVVAGTGALNPGGRPKSTNWRKWLRDATNNGSEIHEILLEIARGNPKIVKMSDGKLGIIVPTAADRARVAIHLDEQLHGKAVTQNEQQRAEREASALQAVQALSDAELEERARRALLARQAGILEGPLGPETEAELLPAGNVETTEQEPKKALVEQIWLAKPE